MRSGQKARTLTYSSYASGVAQVKLILCKTGKFPAPPTIVFEPKTAIWPKKA